jgi:hypothetical protein
MNAFQFLVLAFYRMPSLQVQSPGKSIIFYMVKHIIMIILIPINNL